MEECRRCHTHQWARVGLNCLRLPSSIRDSCKFPDKSDVHWLPGIVYHRHTDPLVDISTAEFDDTVAVNLRGSYLCVREAAK